MTNSNSNEYFQTITKIVNEAKQSGLISKGSGYCFSMSDIILKLLYKEGIKSKLVECSLMVTYKNPPGMYLMGYPGFNQNNYDADTMMQTHIVCVTETEIPILIDASIAHIDKNVPFICAPLNSKEDLTLGNYDFPTSNWIYTQKLDTDLELPKLHQKNILNRIKTDAEVQKKINLIQKLIILALTVSSMNFVRGTYDFYQTYVNSNNDWGPMQSPFRRDQK